MSTVKGLVFNLSFVLGIVAGALVVPKLMKATS